MRKTMSGAAARTGDFKKYKKREERKVIIGIVD